MTCKPAWIIVPVKRLAAAKRRLAGILTSAERIELARTMLEDVLCAIASSGADFSGIIVPTRDDDVADIARRHHAMPVREPDAADLNGAVAFALRRLPGDGAAIVVPSDIPHLCEASLRSIATLIAAPQSAAFVRATVDGGTNLLACRPATLVTPSFGPGSFARHCDSALRAGVTPSIPAWRMMGQDIDRPDDLRAFLAFQTNTRTDRFLRSLDLSSRFAALHERSLEASDCLQPVRQDG